MTHKGTTKATKMRVERELDVPLREISGICLRRCAKGKMSIIAVGDRVATLAWSHLPRKSEGSFDWQTVDIAKLPGSKLQADDPQIEAVCADGAGRVLLLKETPPRAELLD